MAIIIKNVFISSSINNPKRQQYLAKYKSKLMGPAIQLFLGNKLWHLLYEFELKLKIDYVWQIIKIWA